MSPIPVADRNPNYISREQLLQWLDQIAGEMKLIAPRDVDGFILYRSTSEADEVVLDYSRPVLSIKDAYFPPTEQLFQIEKSAEEIKIKESPPPGDQVLFGVRPCDAHGLQAMDALFITTEPSDSYYTRRRESSILVGAACREMGPTCFCTTMGSSPDDTRYMDVMLAEVDGGYSIEVVTDRGRHLLEQFGLELEELTTQKQGTKHNPISGPQIPHWESWTEQFNAPFWESMAERCLSCRACAYVCPTCRCFDVRDEIQSGQENGQVYDRVRCWDSCMRDAYQRIAGGHNPRPEKNLRLRNRIYCKFYYFPLQYGPTACTGCGRCIDVCPVGVDITEIMQHIVDGEIAEHENLVEVGGR